MTRKKKIAIFTGNRAEYGLQYPLIKAIDKCPELEYQIIVSAAHLDKNYGYTIDEIKRDGFFISEIVPVSLGISDETETPLAIASVIVGVAKALARLKPDILVVYADRFEGFAAVIAASQMNIPVAHIEGGDLTEGGALDDSVRHAMTKLAHLHFTTNNQATQRVLGMGEEPWRVHTVGLPSLDEISLGNFATEEELVTEFGLDQTRPLIIFTQHSVSTDVANVEIQIESSIRALKQLANEGLQVIITYPNNDVGGIKIIKKLKDLEQQAPNGVTIKPSLGRFKYHGLLALAERDWKVVCVGNSSSGIKETLIFGCPCVNVGPRQNGRLRGPNVIDVDYNTDQICAAVKQALGKEFISGIYLECRSLYGDGSSAEKIINVLKNINFDGNLLQKKMTLAP